MGQADRGYLENFIWGREGDGVSERESEERREKERNEKRERQTEICLPPQRNGGKRE